MLKLTLQYFGHLMWRTDSLEKTLMPGKIEGRRRRGWQNQMVGWHYWLDGHKFEQAPRVGDGQGSLGCCSPWGRKESDTTERWNWTVKPSPPKGYNQEYNVISKFSLFFFKIKLVLELCISTFSHFLFHSSHSLQSAEHSEEPRSTAGRQSTQLLLTHPLTQSLPWVRDVALGATPVDTNTWKTIPSILLLHLLEQFTTCCLIQLFNIPYVSIFISLN